MIRFVKMTKRFILKTQHISSLHLGNAMNDGQFPFRIFLFHHFVINLIDKKLNQTATLDD